MKVKQADRCHMFRDVRHDECEPLCLLPLVPAKVFALETYDSLSLQFL